MREAGTPRPFPFIVGCPRSGTTLLRVMFDAHPDLTIPLESYFPPSMPPEFLDEAGGFDVGSAVASLEQEAWLQRWDLPEGVFAVAAAAPPTPTYADVIRRLFGLAASMRGTTRYGNKTPRHVLVIPRLARTFAEARFIHVIRDGRDVALSVLEREFGPNDVSSAAHYWRKRVERGREAGLALGDSRYTQVRYEDLLADPDAELRRLCAFIDLPFDGSMLRYHEHDADVVLGSGHRKNLDKPPTAGLRDWRTQMSRRDVWAFESVAAETLEGFGYDRAGVHVSASSRMRIRASGLRADARRRVGGALASGSRSDKGAGRG